MKLSDHDYALHTAAVVRSEAHVRLASPYAHQREFGARLLTAADRFDERAARLAPQPDLFTETDHA
jgi:hypothetical protein